MKQAVFTGKKTNEVHSIDSLPLPDYSDFNIQDMLDNYSDTTRMLYRNSRTHPRPFSIVASRSCPFSCSF